VERVVLDPAVLVSAFVSPLGNSAALWEAVRDQRIEMAICPQLLSELAGVLVRPKFRRYGTLEEVEAFVAEVARYGARFADPVDPPTVSRDPNDDYLVALSQGVEVTALVSGDKDLTEIPDSDPPILTPAAAVAQLL